MGLRQSIHDHNPANIPTSLKPKCGSNYFIIDKKPIFISGPSLIEGISSVEVKIETRIETLICKIGRSREYNGMKL